MAQLPWITSSRRVKIDRLAWIGVLATFAIAILFAARDLSFAFKHVDGWDLDQLCAQFAALSEGKDPYIAANIRDYVPSIDNPNVAPYPIVAAYPAKFLCPIHAAWPNAYVFIYLLVLVCSCAALTYLLLRNVIETALVAIVSICAFAAFRWVALTGNVAILEVPFAVLTILAVHQRRFVVGGVALGLMSSLKMLPLVGVLAFLILPIGWTQKARAVAASLLTFSVIQLVNIMISGSYGASFLKLLLGRIPNQVSPYTQQDVGGFIDFVFRVFGTSGIEKASLIASAIGLCGLAVGGLVTMLAQRTDETHKFATVRLFGLAYLVCMLFLFRLAPYAFAALIPFAIAAVIFPVRALRYIGYLVLVLMPWLFGSARMSLNIGLTREFYQTISLVIFLVVAFGLHGRGARIKPGGPLDMRGDGR
jgi:Glycosyltransferase family 87